VTSFSGNRVDSPSLEHKGPISKHNSLSEFFPVEVSFSFVEPLSAL